MYKQTNKQKYTRGGNEMAVSKVVPVSAVKECEGGVQRKSPWPLEPHTLLLCQQGSNK